MGAREGTTGAGPLTSIVINTVRLHESYGDGPPQWVILLLQLRLPEDGIPILTEVLLGPMASRELTRALFLAEHCHSIQAIVAHMVAGDMGQAGGHHPHTTAFVSWDSEKSLSLTPKIGEAAPSVTPKGEVKRAETSHLRALAMGFSFIHRDNEQSASLSGAIPQGMKCSDHCSAPRGNAQGAPVLLHGSGLSVNPSYHTLGGAGSV